MHCCPSDERDTEVPDGRNESCNFCYYAKLVPECGLTKVDMGLDHPDHHGKKA